MNLFKIHHHHHHHHHQLFSLPISQISPPQPSLSPPHFVSLPFSSFPAISLSKPHSRFGHFRVSEAEPSASVWSNEDDEDVGASSEFDDLAPNSTVYHKTLRLVECSMFAAVSGLAYFLSNSLAIENYFGCFFALPIVISSMRWGVAGGRKTMVATATLLLVLSGPVKALTYMLMHGLVGVTMGSLWRLEANWGLSVFCCTLVRAIGAIGYVLVSSFLIRENILALITINIHASLTYVLTALGIGSIPSMGMIYTIFGTLLLLNCASFVFLLHILYAVFFTRMGMKASLTLPRWLEKAI